LRRRDYTKRAEKSRPRARLIPCFALRSSLSDVGSAKAQQMLLKLAAETQGPAIADKMAIFVHWSEYVDQQTFRLVEEVRAGKPMSDVFPHPDDVELDYEKLEVKINGPTSRRQKLHQDAMLAEFSDLVDRLQGIAEAGQKDQGNDRLVHGGVREAEHP
jgi:hypothetical protein